MKWLVFCVLLGAATSLPAVELVKCPEEIPNGIVILKSQEGKCVELSIDVAEQSTFIRDIIKDEGFARKEVIPLYEVKTNRLLLDIARILDKSYGRSNPYDVIKGMVVEKTKNDPARLIGIIKAASFLDVKDLLHAALDVFSHKIFDEDLARLPFNANGYAIYKRATLEALPLDLVRVMLERNASLFTPALLATFGHESILGAVLSPDSTRILTLTHNGDPKLWDSSARGNIINPIATLQHKSKWKIPLASFSPDSARILTGGLDGTARLWKAHTVGMDSNPRAILHHNGGVTAAIYSPHGDRILTGSIDTTARIWDADARGNNVTPLGTFKHGAEITTVAFSPDGRFVLTGAQDGSIKMWNANLHEGDIEPIATFKHAKHVNALAFSPDGRRVASGTRDGTAKLWDAFAREHEIEPLATFTCGRGVKSLAFSPDGLRVITGSGDYFSNSGRVYAWDTSAKGNDHLPLATFEHPAMAYHEVSLSTDGRLLLTTGADAARLWDAAATGHQVHPLATMKHAGVQSVAFSLDGLRVLTGGGYGARLWALFDSRHATLAEAQTILYVLKNNNLDEARLPPHLRRQLSEHGKEFLKGHAFENSDANRLR